MYLNITANDIKGMIGKANIIDIRDEYLYKAGNIPSSINIPINYLLTNPSKYLNKTDTYYIYCSYGMQSSKACSKLKQNGYNVINILGGYNDYISMY